jgi:hypothetical protein
MGRVSIDGLTQTLKQVQLCVKRLGLVLSGVIGTAKPGRIKGDVEASCNLDVVVIEPGSFMVALDLRTEQETDLDLLGIQVPLGQLAVDKMLEGIDLLAQDTPRLVNEFDYGVLVALRDATHLLERGIECVEFTRRRNGAPARVVNIDRRVRGRVLENIATPIKSAVEIKGTLREVDLEHRSCQIYPQSGLRVDCVFSENHEPSIKELLDTYVRALGEATLREADGRIKKMQIQDIEGFDQATVLDLEAAPPKPRTGRELLAALRSSGLVGMWKDRTDIGDSSEYARTLRESAQRRERE